MLRCLVDDRLDEVFGIASSFQVVDNSSFFPSSSCSRRQNTIKGGPVRS